MKNTIEIIVKIVNIFHDLLMAITNNLGLGITDKDLHFWVIGIIGIFMFIFTQMVFKVLSQWSITAISFIYTFTVLLVVVFAIEIEQKITGKGNMEFADAVTGLYGFLVLFFILLVFKFIKRIISRFINRNNK